MAKQATISSGRSGRRVPSIFEYIQESRNELRKVTWPTGEETRQLTIAVMSMSVAIAAFLYLIDQIFNGIVGKITGISG
ncbi:MAG TPA: preprotein translocase subunit SecE [Chloroflexota bacterium]|nr:preprotein translocase subunit SecE [Chloroflexota bacterium]